MENEGFCVPLKNGSMCLNGNEIILLTIPFFKGELLISFREVTVDVFLGRQMIRGEERNSVIR